MSAGKVETSSDRVTTGGAATIGGVTVTVEPSAVLAGVAVARGCRPDGEPDGLDLAIREALSRAGAEPGSEAVTASVVAEVRNLLRYRKYKPTGRGKPASEYLLNAAREDRFPRLGTLVDINNLISLRSLLPISLVDLDRAMTSRFVVRRGRAGEAYVFNAGGQTIDLEDLLLVACLPDDRPCVNPVKDSMETKLTEASANVMAVIYASPPLRDRLVEATTAFGRALERWGRAATVATAVIASTGP